MLYKLWSKFLTAFGNVKIFKYPFWIIYDPDDYEVTGADILHIMSVIKPGDIILRGYKNYLDGKFIPNFPNNIIGKGFSHGAIYIGNNQIIHAVAEGVEYINIIDFCQCDRIAIFRPKSGTKKAITIANKLIGLKYDFIFKENNNNVYCFELCALTYPKLDIQPIKIKKYFGLIKKSVYIAQSIINSKKCKLIFCKNVKYYKK